VLLGPLGLPNGERADEAPLLVVLVYGLLGRLPAVQPPGRDAEPLGRLYACSEDRIREAASEKGTSTSRRFSDHAAFARSSNCLLVSRSLSSRSQSSSSSSGSTTERRISAGKNVSVLTPMYLSRSSTSPLSVLRGGCSSRNDAHCGRGIARSRNTTMRSCICCRSASIRSAIARGRAPPASESPRSRSAW